MRPSLNNSNNIKGYLEKLILFVFDPLVNLIPVTTFVGRVERGKVGFVVAELKSQDSIRVVIAIMMQ